MAMPILSECQRYGFGLALPKARFENLSVARSQVSHADCRFLCQGEQKDAGYPCRSSLNGFRLLLLPKCAFTVFLRFLGAFAKSGSGHIS